MKVSLFQINERADLGAANGTDELIQNEDDDDNQSLLAQEKGVKESKVFKPTSDLSNRSSAVNLLSEESKLPHINHKPVAFSMPQLTHQN